ncbi:MAG: hypothetical protein OEY14_05215 [Myxococcales bacterium]|nr:hypothetical protein [Myxococcales bacterium]
MTSTHLSLIVGTAASTLLLASSAPLAAQQMGEGQARITARSDVRLQLESGPGTGREKIAAIGAAVGGQMGPIRRCYAEAVESDPTIRGSLRLELTLGRRARIAVQRDEVENRALLRCVTRALEAGSFSGIEPPGTAYLILEFTNSAAEGVERTRDRRQVEDAVPVERDAEGRPRAAGGTPDGTVGFVVRGAASASEGAVAAAQRSLRGAIPILLDCRRRAGRRGGDPAGEIEVAVQVSARGQGRARIVRNTVRNRHGTRQAAQCMSRGLEGVSFDPESAGALTVIVTFAPERAAAAAPSPAPEARP